jgi:hypothetical protein
VFNKLECAFVDVIRSNDHKRRRELYGVFVRLGIFAYKTDCALHEHAPVVFDFLSVVCAVDPDIREIIERGLRLKALELQIDPECVPPPHMWGSARFREACQRTDA